MDGLMWKLGPDDPLNVKDAQYHTFIVDELDIILVLIYLPNKPVFPCLTCLTTIIDISPRCI
jgi:hypothetical protein